MILFRNWLLLALVGAPISASAADAVDHYGGRDVIVHVPVRLPASGSRALVVVLHGGMGNADRIANGQSESGLNMDAEADRDGFIVVYLNGTPATRLLGRALGWNAGGGCCGQPARNETDDVAYISGAVGYLAGKYGVDRGRVFGIGHSNGAMMTQRILCETSLYAAGVAISGPLNLAATHCPGAKGKRILAIHGADDQNVPIAGGRGTRGLAQVAWTSEARARQVMTGSGARYDLQIVPGADHMLDHLSATIAKSEGVTIARKAAAFFGLTGKKG
jgi:poly(3-hydroxybutyrate) depolymerase